LLVHFAALVFFESFAQGSGRDLENGQEEYELGERDRTVVVVIYNTSDMFALFFNVLIRD
jgi:hypothetical protein